MLLSDGEIREAIESGDLIIDPKPSNSSIQAVSVDLRLYHSIRVQSEEPVPGISLDPETLDVARHLEAYPESTERTRAYRIEGDGRQG